MDSLQAQGLLSDRASKAMRAVERAHFVQTYTGVPGSIAYQVRSTMSMSAVQGGAGYIGQQQQQLAR